MQPSEQGAAPDLMAALEESLRPKPVRCANKECDWRGKRRGAAWRVVSLPCPRCDSVVEITEEASSDAR